MSGQAVRVIGASLAALAALALVAAAVVLLTRSDDAAPVRIVAPETTPVGNAVADIRVQVSGAVMLPGVYPMNPGDRVIDAIAAAGGVAPDADLSGVNLSMRVQDETRYHIPVFGEIAPTIPSTSAKTAERNGGLIDLNTAQARELEALPGIGPVLSGAIVAYREDNGPFAAVDEVDNVPGIGPKMLDNIRQLVTVSGRP